MKKLFLLTLILIGTGSAQALFNRDRYYEDGNGEYVERRGGLLGGIVDATEDVAVGVTNAAVDIVTFGGRDYPVYEDNNGGRYYVRNDRRVYLD